VNTFYGIPTKLTILAIVSAWLIISFPAVPQSAEHKEPLMDLRSGGVDFFKEIVPSIVQIYNSSVYISTLSPYGGSGSGYIFDREGHFITNAHVTAGSPVFEVAFYSDHQETKSYVESRWRAELIAEDPALDLAICKVEAPADKFHPVRLGDSAIVNAGDTVATFGSPGGDPGTVDQSWINWQQNWLEFYNLNMGVITQVLNFQESSLFYRERSYLDPLEQRSRVGTRDYGSAVQYLLQTDSAINQGNSGGPCLNMFGEAIGTNTWGGWYENWGFSVPTNLLKKSATDMLQYGRVRRPWCGISLHPYWDKLATSQIEHHYNLGIRDHNLGAWWDTEPDQKKIYFVNPYSPAYQAGLRENDIILTIDGKDIKNIYDIYSYFLDGEIGQKIVFQYERNGHGMPPAVVTLDEKRTRYDGVSITLGGSGRRVGDDTFYTMRITY